MSSRFMYCKVPFPYSVFWKQDTKSSLHSSTGDLSFISWRGTIYTHYLQSFVKKICLFSHHLFIYSIMYLSVCMCVYLFYTLCYNPILCFLFSCSSCGIESSLKLAPVSFWHAFISFWFVVLMRFLNFWHYMI